MNHRLIDALMAGIAPVIRDYVAGGLESLANRIKTLEEREPVKGEKGEPGQDGAAGRDGIDGKDGTPGEPGPAGERGVDGKDGEPGQPGENGLDGIQGKEGAPGRDGRDGLPGVQGEKGLDGKDGREGVDGKDGFGFDDIVVEHDGERGFTFRFVRGDQVKEFGKFTVPATIYRGVWKEGEFERGDEVTYAGSQFVAKRSTTAKPEISDDWQLACKRGRDGKDGKPGEKGLQGLKGERGEQGHRGFVG